MMAAAQGPAGEIETAVRQTPGVSSVFRSGGILSKAIEAGAQLIGAGPDAPSLIGWEDGPEGPRIEVAIGVHASAGASATSWRVHTVVAAHCAELGIVPAEILVTVVHIDEGATHAPAW